MKGRGRDGGREGGRKEGRKNKRVNIEKSKRWKERETDGRTRWEVDLGTKCGSVCIWFSKGGREAGREGGYARTGRLGG